MRIALVTEYYYPHLGGVTEHVHNLALQFRALGHTPLVVTSRMEGAHDDPPFVRRIGTSRVLFSNGSFARVTTGWRLTAQIEDILRRERIDVVHDHGGMAPMFGLVAPQAAHRVGVPVVSTFHSWFPRSGGLGFELFRRPLQKRLDRVGARIAVSRPVIQAHSRYFDTTWDIIPNGVDVTDFHPNGRRPVDTLSSAPRLLFLGRLDPRNGLETVLDALPAVVAHHPETSLVVVGDGPLRGFYERRARPLGSRVRFVGRVYEERPHYYATSDLYLCPTKRASFGITLLEAMASGTPIVASDITGFRELVGDGHEALLLPPDDPPAWAAGVIRLIADPARRAAMARAGLDKAAGHSW